MDQDDDGSALRGGSEPGPLLLRSPVRSRVSRQASSPDPKLVEIVQAEGSHPDFDDVVPYGKLLAGYVGMKPEQIERYLRNNT